MVDPFDIYRTGMGAEAAPAMNAAGNAARQRALLALRVQEMMGAGAAAAPEAAAAKTPGMMGRLAAKVPGFGAIGRFAGRAIPGAGAVAGVVDAATDTPETMLNQANSMGLDYNSFGGRVTTGAVNFAENVANGATFGAAGWAGDKIKRLVTGQPFFDPVTGGAKPAAPALANTALDREDAYDMAPNPGYGMVASAPAAPAFASVAPMTAADIRSRAVPASGTGAMMNNVTGAVTNLDTRAANVGAVANPNRVEASRGDSPLAMFYGAGMNMRREAQTAAGAAAKYKIDAEYGAGSDKSAAAMKHRVETASLMERQRLASLETDPIKRAAILAGHNPPTDTYSIPFPPMDDKSPVVRIHKGSGAVDKVTPTTPITIAQAVASAKKNGTYKSDAQVRADLARIPGYKLTD